MLLENPYIPNPDIFSEEEHYSKPNQIPEAERYQDRITGAHFKYEELCAMLLKLYDQREDPETFSQALDDWEIVRKVKRNQVPVHTLSFEPKTKVDEEAVELKYGKDEEAVMEKLKAMIGLKRNSAVESGEMVHKLNSERNNKPKASDQKFMDALLNKNSTKVVQGKVRVVSFKLDTKQNANRVQKHSKGNFAFYSQRCSTLGHQDGKIEEKSHKYTIASP